MCSKTSHYLSIKWQATVHFYDPQFWTLVMPDLGCKARLDIVCKCSHMKCCTCFITSPYNPDGLLSLYYSYDPVEKRGHRLDSVSILLTPGVTF